MKANRDAQFLGLEIGLRDERMVLLPNKAIWWPASSTLFVADTHFGKTAAFRAVGIPTPDNTTTDLARLEAMLQTTQSERLIVLGDFWHSIEGRTEEVMQLLTAWRERHPTLEIVVVRGNHDRGTELFPESWRIAVTDAWATANGPFRGEHEPAFHERQYVLCGHIHPAFLLTDRHGGGLRSPCFVVGERRAILPAFGSFTGSEIWRPQSDDRIFMIGPAEVIEIPRPRRH